MDSHVDPHGEAFGALWEIMGPNAFLQKILSKLMGPGWDFMGSHMDPHGEAFGAKWFKWYFFGTT